MLGFIKMKVRRHEVSSVPAFQHICLEMNPSLQETVDEVNRKTAERKAARQKRTEDEESDDEDESAGGIGDPEDESSESSVCSEGEAPVGSTVATQPQDTPHEKTSDPEQSPNPTLASSSDTKKDEGKTDTVVTVDSPEDAKTKQLEKGQPTQEGHVEKTEAQGVKDEVSPVAFQGCRKEEAKQSNLSAEEANSSAETLQQKREELVAKLAKLRSLKFSSSLGDGTTPRPASASTRGDAGRKVEKDCAAGHIDQVDTQPVDVMTAKTPEHKEPLFSPGHAAQQKREVYQTKGNVLPNQSDTKCYDKARPEPGTHEPKKACKAKEDEDFTESDREVSPPKARTTRMDQLKLKHAKKAKADEGDQLVQPSHRGRGPGRGRGRGCVVKDKSAGSEKGNPRKTKDSKKEKKQSATDGGAIFYGYTLDEWTAWDAACTWSQNYEHGKGFEVEAWDKVAILEQKKSIYELHQLGNEQAESAASAADAAEPKRRKKAPAELSKPAKGSTEEPSSSGSSKDKKIKAKNDTGSKRKKPKRGEAIEGDDTAGEAKEERKRKNSRKGDEAEAHQEQQRKQRTRNSRVSESHAPEDPQTNEGTPRARAARPQARARAAHPQAEPAVAEAPEFSMVLPATKDGRLKEIMSFMKGFQDLKEDTQIRQAMRMRLACFSNTCRLNVYWSRTAVGLTCRAEKNRFGLFSKQKQGMPRKVSNGSSTQSS